MNTLKATALLIVFGSSLLFSQQHIDSSANHRCEAFLERCWAVPGLPGAKTQGRGPLRDLDGVFLSVLEPRETETWLFTPICPAGADKASEYKSVPIKVMKLWSFDAGGAAFAYRVEYADEVIHQDGTRGELASYSVVFFYDTDGSSHFTLMRPSSMIGRNYFDPDFIPKWIKQAAAHQPMK